jgi:hypothetical protein
MAISDVQQEEIAMNLEKNLYRARLIFTIFHQHLLGLIHLYRENFR